MTEIFLDNWRDYLGLGTDQLSGAAMTLWLLVLSFTLALLA